MSLAHAYAEVIQAEEERGPSAGFSDKLFAFMKSRGHISLIPHIARILDRLPSRRRVIVTLTDENAEQKFSSEITQALVSLHAGDMNKEIVIDPRIVGGFSVRAGNGIVDRTFRTALVSLYQNTIRQ